ncbi:DIS3-like exonuclease 1-like protein [Dichotomocladium elegans]|nr:DIS3-like exonuclease 1-like protein [Dichotomocladium elegans]
MTNCMAIKSDRAFFRKTRGNAIVKLVREQYLRNDISCMVNGCTSCMHGENQPHAVLSLGADHYVVPDVSIVMRYLEILEHEDITGIILGQTIMTSLEQHDKMRTLRKLRQIVNDSRHKSAVFYNDIFVDTRVERIPGESAAERDWRALCRMADWYSRHLGNKHIVLLSEMFTTSATPSDHVVVMTMGQYIAQHWPDHTLLNSLASALAEAVFEDDLERIRISSSSTNSRQDSAVAGYTEYKSMEELEAGIKSSRYFSGVLKCRQGTRDTAYVNGGSQLGKDILIVGSGNMNRSVHGDLVVVELLSESHWTTAPNVIAYGGTSAEDEFDELRLASSTENMRPTGRVVGILNRNWRSYVATIQEDPVEGGWHLAIPLDSVIPKIRIRHQDVKLIQNQRIVVRIDSWPISSQYPNGHYVRSLGPIHQLDTEISAILVEHSISVSQAFQGFSEASLKEMPIDTPDIPWKPDEHEIRRRRDLRSLIVFSIDPPNCQDIDDALSIREISKDALELGVHIADVSFFVKENSLTDLEARARGTTVYLADRRFDMLPSVLSERVCSLRENVDRYAVSVLWTLDKATFQVKNTWFGRTIIRSTCEMEYEQAQQLLDGEPVATNLNRSLGNKLRPCIMKLAEVLRTMRRNRLSNGALELESNEVKFKIAENNQITDIISKGSMEIHGLVAEAMIMANAYVGRRVYEGFKDAAILRRHPPPNPGQFEMLVKAAGSRGYTIDFSSNKALGQSLDIIAQASRDDPEMVKLMKTMATVAMNEAGYISAGHESTENYFHYGLALDFYTHFTSPIRRYADVVAHRQLLLCVQDPVALEDTEGRPSGMTQDAKVAEICERLNLKSRESKFAQRDSTELFQSLYVLQHTSDGPLIETGVIAEIRSNGFFVFIPALGLKGPVFLVDRDGQTQVPRSLQSGNDNHDEEFIPNCSIEVNMPTSISVTAATLPHPIQFNLFDHVRVSLKLRKSHAHRHMVYMTLIDLKPSELLLPPKRNLLTSIQKEEQEIIQSQKESAVGMSKEEIETRRALKKSSHKQGSIYDVLEQFRKLTLVEITSETTSSHSSTH